MATLRVVLAKALFVLGTLLSAWGGAIAGGAVGLFLGGLLGPLLASVNMGLVLDKMASYFGFPPGVVWLIEFALNWIPFFGIAKAILGVITGWLAGMGVGACVGVIVGVIVVLVSSVESVAERKVAASVGAGLTGTRLDYFFGGAISNWLKGLVFRNAVGVVLGVGIAEWLRYWSASLPFDHVGPEYMVSLVFSVPTVGFIGATVGYLVAALCFSVQRQAPWALAGTAPGVLVAELLGATDPLPYYSWALVGALTGHVLCLVVGPLRGKLSIAREGAIGGAAVGLLLLDSPGFAFFSAAGSLMLGKSLVVLAPRTAAATVGGVGGGMGGAAGAGFSVWPILFSFRSVFGACGGFFLGGFFGHPGGLLPWLCLGVAVGQLGLIRTRWAEAGVQAQAFASGTGASVAVGAGGVGALGAGFGGVFGLAGMGVFGVVFGTGCLGIAAISGFSALSADSVRPSVAAQFGFAPEAPPRVAARSASSARSAPAPGIATVPAPTAAAAPAPTTVATTVAATQAVPAHAAEASVVALLRSYYEDLNTGRFDADQYFEPNVERYISMVGTSTAAMNRYINLIFPKQFKEHHFEFVEGTLKAEGPREYVYTESSRYFQVSSKRHKSQRASVRIRLSPAGKIVSFQQFDAKSTEPTATPSAKAPAPPASHSPRAALAGAKPAVRAECAVPYRVDERGIKRLKPECS